MLPKPVNISLVLVSVNLFLESNDYRFLESNDHRHLCVHLWRTQTFIKNLLKIFIKSVDKSMGLIYNIIKERDKRRLTI